MIKAVFYLNNAKIHDTDLSHPEDGNPGCGGTEYMLAAIPHYLAQKISDLDIAIFSATSGRFSRNVKHHVTGNLLAGVQKALDEDYDFFIYKPAQTDNTEVEKIIALCQGTSLSLIPWFQLTPGAGTLRKMAACSNYAACACVEHEQLDSLRDHPIHRKTVVIPNALSLKPYKRPITPITERKKQVFYLGSLVSQKGFKRLARAWPLVLQKIPDATLLVAGSGKLYDRNAVLGQWGIAEETFERTAIRPYLSDENGKIHPSVSFLGVIGEEKIDYISQSRIGIVNPVGTTETFCIAAIEIQAAGTPVIGGAMGGLFDTIRHKETGFLVRNHTELARRIVQLLSSPEQAQSMANAAVSFVEKNYRFEQTTEKWHNLFHLLHDQQRLPITPPKKRISSLPMGFVRINAFLKYTLGLTFLPSSLEMMKTAKQLKRQLLK